MKKNRKDQPNRVDNLLIDVHRKIQKGEFTREEFDKIAGEIVAPGWSVADLVKFSILFEEVRWSSEGKLIPDYSKVPQYLELNEKEQEKLLKKVQDTGKPPGRLIMEFIRDGLGLEGGEEDE